MTIRTISERQRAMEERKRQSIIDRALHESDVLRRIRMKHAEEKANEKALFCLWFLLDQHLKSLEHIRDTNLPDHTDTDWNPDFCNAIQLIPDVRRACNNVWFAYCISGKSEFYNWL